MALRKSMTASVSVVTKRIYLIVLLWASSDRRPPWGHESGTRGGQRAWGSVAGDRNGTCVLEPVPSIEIRRRGPPDKGELLTDL